MSNRRGRYPRSRAWIAATLFAGCASTADAQRGADAATACTLTSQCPGGQYCGAAGTCTLDCREDRDCEGRGRCEASIGRCLAVDAGARPSDDLPRVAEDRPPTTDILDAGPPPTDVNARDVTAVDLVTTPADVVEASVASPDAGCGPEVCNGIDDDCDGVIDDLSPTACAAGPCATGTRRCPMGTPMGTRFVENASPICVAESFAPSSTVCRPAAGPCDVAERCTGSAETCPADQVIRLPSSESCNNVDDDCDGMIDDGAACPAGRSCIAGACVAVSPDGLVDPDTQASAITLLRDARDGALTVVYQDQGGGRSDVRTARFDGRWSIATAFRNMLIEKEGADLDAAGALHAVLGDPGGTTLYYANTRGGAWSTPAAVPGMPGGGGTLDLDDSGAVHVCSNARLSTRRYSTNAGGQWLGAPPQVSGSGTAPGAIVARGANAPAIAHAVWNARRIDFGEAPGWSATALSSYGVDQGPPISMVARNGALAVAYVLTTDAYTNYSLFFQQRPAGGAWTGRTELIGSVRGISSLELSLDEAGARYAAFCIGGGEVRVASDRSGAWRVSPLIVTSPCLGAMDALVSEGRIYLAFRSTAGQLHVASFETAGL